MKLTREYVVGEFFGGQAEGNVERMMKVMHPNLRIVESAELPYAGEYHGIEGFMQIMQKIGSKLSLSISELSFYDAPPYAFALSRLTFTSNATGASITTSAIDRWAFSEEDGRATEILPYYLEPGWIKALCEGG